VGEPYKVSMEGVHWFVRGRGMFTQCHDRDQAQQVCSALNRVFQDAHAAGLATAQAELKAANDNAEFIVAHLHQVVRLLREEVKYSRVHLIREEHPDGGTVAPFYSLNTHGTQADDCNYADARAAVDDAKALADPVIP